MQKTLMIKLIAVIVVLMLSLSNFLVLASYAAEISKEVFVEDVSKQDSDTNNKNVKFDSYFKLGQENSYSAVLDLTDSNKVYVKIKLSDSGYLKNGVINFEQESFNIKVQEEVGQTIQNIDYEEEQIILNQINAGTEIELEIPIEIDENEMFNIKNLNKTNKVLFTGIYLTEKGKEVEIEKEILLNLKWDSEIEVVLEQNINKYVNNDNNETLLELNLNTFINQNIMPLKETSVEVHMPEIEGKYPKYVNVVANDLLSTTGKQDGEGFERDCFEYNEEEKTLRINVHNIPNENGEVSWTNGIDEYKIILVYENLSEDEKTVVVNSKAKFDIYGKTEILEKDISSEIILNENIGTVNNIAISSEEDSIYKSFMYANSEYETEYNLIWNVDIGYANISDKVLVSDVNESFVNNETEKVEASLNTYYKQTIINKENFEKILGEEGYIKILNELDEELSKITFEMIQDENIIINYQDADINKIKIETSKPLTEGTLEIKHTKAVKKKTDFEREFLKSFVTFENEINLTTIYNKVIENTEEESKEVKQVEITNINTTNSINLLEPETRIEVKTSADSLMTNTVNEDVEINVSLINNKKEYALYSNPIVDIKLPEEINNIEIKDVRILFEEELTIKSSELIRDDKGIKYIRITLDGIQTKYNIDNIINGVNIIINTDITLKEIEETKQAELEVICLNDEVETVVKTNINLIKVEKEEIKNEPVETPSGKVEELPTIVPTVNPNEEVEKPYEEELKDNQEENINQQEELDIKISSSVQEETWVKCGEIVKYTINVKNNSNKTLKNIELLSQVPENTVYTSIPTEDVFGPVGYEDDYTVENIRWYIEEIKPGETIAKEYEVRFNKEDKQEGEVEVLCSAKAIVDNKDVISNTVKNILTKGYVELFLKTNFVEESLVKNDSMIYTMSIKNIAGEDLENVKMVFNIPKGIICEEAYISEFNSDKFEFKKITEGFDIKDEKVELNIPKLENGNYKNIEIALRLNNPSEVENRKLQDKFEVTVNDIVHYSNIVESAVNLPTLKVRQMSSYPEGDIKNNNILKYIVQVENIGDYTATNVTVTDSLPKNVKYITSEKYIGDEKEEFKSYANGIVSLSNDIKAGEKATYVITVKTLGADNTSLENVVKIKAEGLEEVEINKIKHTINDDSEIDYTNQQSNTNSSSSQQMCGVSGVAWIDENKDGKRDIDETLLSGVEVVLIDSQNNVQTTTKTNDSGYYSFRDLSQGKYSVIFIYDSNAYGVTKYNAYTDESINSDVIETKIELNGKEKLVGMTDKIDVNKDVVNIDVGLVRNPKFDLRLEKYISEVTVKTPKGNTTYNYDNKKLAKVEFESKHIDNSEVSINYTIKVTNEGQVEGYANKIVDYLPEELTFNKELNPNWYQGEDGNLYIETLKNEKVAPGSSKEIKLVLSKKMSGEDTGIVNNNAEIMESTNNYGLLDIDSTYGNKNANEDDIDYANVYLGVKTGRTLLYISLVISQTIVLAAGIYLIKKKVLAN